MNHVARSKKFKITELEVVQLNLPDPEHITLFAMEQTGRPVPECIMLGGRYSPGLSNG